MIKQCKSDWRADITGCSSLYDVDYYDAFIFFRHEYLSAAKNLLKSGSEELSYHAMSEIAEAMQRALEAEGSALEAEELAYQVKKAG